MSRFALPLPRFGLALEPSDLTWALGRIGRHGPEELARLEAAFAQEVGLRRAFFVPSARLGMYLALKALNLPPGAVVLMPAWTHPSMPAMVVAAGLTPRIADIARGTWTMGCEQIPEEAWQGVRVVVATHMYGCPAPVAELTAEARRRGAILLEDCAQGLGARSGQLPAGVSGVASFYSFALTKNYTTLGGGMVGVQDADLAERLEELLGDAPLLADRRVVPTLVKAAAFRVATARALFAAGVYPALAAGWLGAGRDLLHPLFEERFSIEPPRTPSRPSPLQAALGLRLLPRLEEHNSRRAANGLALLERLKALDLPELGLPEIPAEGRHIFMSFVVTWPDRQALARELFRLGVDSSPGYLRPVTRVGVLAGRVEQFGPCPEAERLETRQLHLPIYPGLNERDLDRMAEAVGRAARVRPSTMKFSTMVRAGTAVLKSRVAGVDYPLFAILSTNNTCQSRCRYCRIPSRAQKEMSTEQILGLIDQMAEMGTQRLGLWGGEPLLRPDITRIVSHARQRGLYVTLDTNGYLLPERRELLDHLDHLILSLDGPEEAHDANREPGSWKKVMAALDCIPPGRTVWTITVLTRHNIQHVDWILDEADRRGFVPTFQVLHHNELFGINDELRPSAEEYAQVLRYLAEQKRRGRRIGTSVGCFEHLAAWKDYQRNTSPEGGLGWKKCWGGKFFVNIDTNGDLYPCSLTVGELPAPNALELGFAEAYRQVAPPPCQSCLATCYSEYNLLFSLNFRTILQWVRALGRRA